MVGPQCWNYLFLLQFEYTIPVNSYLCTYKKIDIDQSNYEYFKKYYFKKFLLSNHTKKNNNIPNFNFYIPKTFDEMLAEYNEANTLKKKKKIQYFILF